MFQSNQMCWQIENLLLMSTCPDGFYCKAMFSFTWHIWNKFKYAFIWNCIVIIAGTLKNHHYHHQYWATKSLQCLTNFMPIWTLQSHRTWKRRELLHSLTPIWEFRNLNNSETKPQHPIDPVTRRCKHQKWLISWEQRGQISTFNMEFNSGIGLRLTIPDKGGHNNMWISGLILQFKFWREEISRPRICFVVTVQQQ